MINVLIVIPTYNNHKTLREVVIKAIDTGIKVLVVNDGSTDNGPDTLKGLETSLINHQANSGKGAAILSGAKWAEKNGFTHIITIDADGQHDPNDYFRFIRLINDNPCSIVVGARRFPPSVVPFSSRFGRKWSNLWFRISSGYDIPDSQSGFRAYPVPALRQIHCRSSRYDFEVEILVRGAWAGLNITHTDISVHYSQETRKASHFDPFMDNVRISNVYTRLVTRNFIPMPHKVIFNRNSKDKLSFAHPLRSFKILLKDSSSPRKMAFSAMLGIFFGTLPLIACHSVVIFFFATKLRLNRLVALGVSNLCVPPFVPALSVEVGYLIRHGKYLTELNWQTMGNEAPQRLLEYLIGSLIVGPTLSFIIGLTVYILALAYRKRNLSKNQDAHVG